MSGASAPTRRSSTSPDARLASDTSGEFADTTLTGVDDDFFESNQYGIALAAPEYTLDDGADGAAVEFVIPWLKVILISVGAYFFSLLTTFLPARQAALSRTPKLSATNSRVNRRLPRRGYECGTAYLGSQGIPVLPVANKPILSVLK